MGDQDVVAAGQGINVTHHSVGSVNHREVISEQFLSPTADDVNGTIIIEDFLDSAAIAEPIEESSPKEFFILRDSPAAASSFANERVEVTLLLGAFPRVKSDWAQTGTAHGDIKVADAVGAQSLQGANRYGESSGCMRIQPMPSADQSVLRKHGLD